jgi:maleylacetoacetate isomerase
MIKLYSYFRSSTSFRLRIALNLKGLEYEHHSVNLPGSEHRTPEFLKINPQGLVPALVNGDTVVIQSMAMIEYLDETRPEPPLLPKEPERRAYVRALSQVIGCEMHPLNNVRVLKHVTDTLGHDKETMQEWYEHWIAEGFEGFESFLHKNPFRGKFCDGDAVTMADICLVPQVFNAQRFHCRLDDYPTTMRIFDACMELDAFQRAEPSRQPDAV